MQLMDSLDVVKVEINDGIAEVLISRPKALNAINDAVLDGLDAVFAGLVQQHGIACVILTGEGDRAFVAGADIAAMSDLSQAEAQAFSEKGHRILKQIEDFPAPVLGAINGYALGGGCELALACDILYASEKARFGQPEVGLGLMPGFGGTVRLPRKIGLAAASEWIYTGDVYSANAAKEVGLVREVLPPADLMKRVREIAGLIVERGSVAVSAAKKSMVFGLGKDSVTAAKYEQVAFGELFTTEDMREGTQAFLDKRKPEFKGN